jgi:hypothetical protein
MQDNSTANCAIEYSAIVPSHHPPGLDDTIGIHITLLGLHLRDGAEEMGFLARRAWAEARVRRSLFVSKETAWS